MIDGYLLDQV